MIPLTPDVGGHQEAFQASEGRRKCQGNSAGHYSKRPPLACHETCRVQLGPCPGHGQGWNPGLPASGPGNAEPCRQTQVGRDPRLLPWVLIP